jgi:hypothetical protein
MKVRPSSLRTNQPPKTRRLQLSSLLVGVLATSAGSATNSCTPPPTVTIDLGDNKKLTFLNGMGIKANKYGERTLNDIAKSAKEKDWECIKGFENREILYFAKQIHTCDDAKESDSIFTSLSPTVFPTVT